MTNPVLPTTALLRVQMPGVYSRHQIYDPTWTDPDYDSFEGKRIIPAVSSVVRDSDETPLWVVAVDPDTHVPTYVAMPIGQTNSHSVSLLNYGNSVLRLYVDTRTAPYAVTPDAKCMFFGTQPRFYTLVRHPGQPNETVISRHFSSSGQLISNAVPMRSMNSDNSNWYLPRCHISQILVPDEEVLVRIYGENDIEVYSALLHAKEAAVLNEDVLYAPSIESMQITGTQRLPNGVFYLYEKQDFESLGLKVKLTYDNGTTLTVPIDNSKCILYGQSDFISSFAGLKQTLTVKYYRSAGESLSPALGDRTGEMISVDIPVTVIPNTLATTNKILTIPYYSQSLSRYVMKYWMYFADGRGHVDVSAYVTLKAGTLNATSSHFGVKQVVVIGLDMSQVDPVNYPTSAIYQQTLAITFGPPNTVVRWTIQDASTAPNVLGQDNSQSRRPSIRYDAALNQYFVPNYFSSLSTFLHSFYTLASPPFDPKVSLTPQTPTHFVVRDITTGQSRVAAPIPINNFKQAFTIISDINGQYNNAVVVVEFLNEVSPGVRRVLFGCPVDVRSGTFV